MTEHPIWSSSCPWIACLERILSLSQNTKLPHFLHGPSAGLAKWPCKLSYMHRTWGAYAASHIKPVLMPMHEIGYGHVRLAIGTPSFMLKNLLSSADLRGLWFFVNIEQSDHDFITIHVVSNYMLSAVMCLWNFMKLMLIHKNFIPEI